MCCNNPQIVYDNQCGNVCTNCGECDFYFESRPSFDGYVIRKYYKNIHHITHYLNCLQGIGRYISTKHELKEQFGDICKIEDIKERINNQVLRKYLTYIYCILNDIPLLRINYKDCCFIKNKILLISRQYNSNAKRCPHYSYIMLVLIDKYPKLKYIKPYILYNRKNNTYYNLIYNYI